MKANKWRLLKDTPTNKKGDIFEENHNYFGSLINFTKNGVQSFRNEEVMSNPEWFEEVKDPSFKKKFNIGNSRGITLTEHFETVEQRDAELALKEHIYKFAEPGAGDVYYYLASNLNFNTIDNYGGDMKDLINYKSGIIMNTSVLRKDRAERLRLLEEVIKHSN